MKELDVIREDMEKKPWKYRATKSALGPSFWKNREVWKLENKKQTLAYWKYVEKHGHKHEYFLERDLLEQLWRLKKDKKAFEEEAVRLRSMVHEGFEEMENRIKAEEDKKKGIAERKRKRMDAEARRSSKRLKSPKKK